MLDAIEKLFEDLPMKTNAYASSKDSRTEASKILRCHARILSKTAPPISARTVDISMSGICLEVPESIASGEVRGITFTTLRDGQPMQVNAVAKVIYSICTGTTGFRIGFEFTDIDGASRITLSKILV